MQVYVSEQGAVVRKKGGLLWVTKGKDTLKELPLMQIEQLILVGNVQVWPQ
jgi:CRISPR/Cas system-associated endonuclease Cas1